MTVRPLVSGLAALSLAAVAVVGAAVPAGAQNARCASTGAGGNANQYAPEGQGQGVSDGTAERGQRISASSGCARFAPGRSIAFGVESVYQQLGTTTSTQFGEATATFTVPSNLENGRHSVVFTGPSTGGAETTVRVPFTVVAGTVVGGGPVGSSGRANALPLTGSQELVGLSVGGVALIALGIGTVVVARRRREDLPAHLA